MASMRDIKRRKESVQSTGQITKAMKLVSSVKLQKAKVGAEVSKPYFDAMYEAVAAMIAKSGEMSHPFLQKSRSDKKSSDPDHIEPRIGRWLQLECSETVDEKTNVLLRKTQWSMQLVQRVVTAWSVRVTP